MKSILAQDRFIIFVKIPVHASHATAPFEAKRKNLTTDEHGWTQINWLFSWWQTRQAASLFGECECDRYVRNRASLSFHPWLN
jgi:hypothetical protein